jgi:hypothetical protein
MTTSDDTAQIGADDEDVDFLVALEHAPLVRSVLDRQGVTERTYEADKDLGLARIVGGFRRSAAAAGNADAGDHHLPRPVDPEDPVDAVLGRLRHFFETRYASWSPTMGKNRTLGQVTDGGSISHGGGSSPRPAPPGPRRRGRAGLGMTVGVLDTALYPHPDLAGGYVGVSGDDVLDPVQVRRRTRQPYAAGHATFVTGLVLEKAPAATVRVHSILNARGEATSWDVARAIVALGRTGIQILNLSLVCYTRDGKAPLALATAIDRLDPEILVVACAGNHGDPTLTKLADDDHRKPSWPAALDDVVAVGSAERDPGAAPGSRGYTLSDFTPWDAVWIDVVTRGENVRSTYFTGTGFESDPDREPSEAEFDGWAQWSGTSFSAALLTGQVAAVAARKRITPRAALEQLMDPIRPRSPRVADPRVPPFLDL